MNSRKLSAITAITLFLLSILPINVNAYAFDVAGSVIYVQNLDPASGADLIVTALDATDILFLVWNAGCNPTRTEKFKFTKSEIKEGITDTIDQTPGYLGFNPGESFAVLITGTLIGPDFFPNPDFDIAVFANAERGLGGARWAALNIEDGFQVLNLGADISIRVPDDATFQDVVDENAPDFLPGESRDYFTPFVFTDKDFCNNEEECLLVQEQHGCQAYNVRNVDLTNSAPFPPFIIGSPFEPPFLGQLVGLVREQVGGDDPATVGYQTTNIPDNGQQIVVASYADHFGSRDQILPLTIIEDGEVSSIQSPQGLKIPERSFVPNPTEMAIGVTRAVTQGLTANYLSIVNHADFEVEVVVEGYDPQCTKFDRVFALTPLDTVLIDINTEFGTTDPLLLVVKAVDIDGNLDTTAEISSKVFYEEFDFLEDQEFFPTAEYRLHNVEAFQTADRIEFVGPSSMYTPFHSTADASGQTLVIGNPSALIGGAKTLNLILNQADEETFSSTQTVGCVQQIDPTSLNGAIPPELFGVNVFGDNNELVIGAAFEQLIGEFSVSAEQAVGTDRTTAAIPIQVRPPESTNFQVFITPFIDPITDPSWDLTVYGVQTLGDGSEVKDTFNIVCPTTTVTPGVGVGEAFAANLACKVPPTSTKTILEICNDDMDPDCFELGIHPS